MKNILGERLKKARQEMGLSQGALARALSFSSEYISQLEAGKRNPRLENLHKIAAFLKKDIAYFFEEKETAFNLLLRGEGLDKHARAELLKFRRYCEEYLRLEELLDCRLDIAPLYTCISPERMADEERRRLGLGEEPIRDLFSLMEMNGCRVFRHPIAEESKVSGIFIFLEAKNAAFVLINSTQSLGRQVFTAAHEYCHYLKDRYEGPVIDNPDVFIDEYVTLYHPREQFAQAFAARFLIPPAKVQELVDKDFKTRRLTYEHALYLKRYFGVSTQAMLRTLKNMGFISHTQFEKYLKFEPDTKEKELFGSAADEEREGGVGAVVSGVGGRLLRLGRRKSVPSERFRLLSLEASRKKVSLPEKPG